MSTAVSLSQDEFGFIGYDEADSLPSVRDINPGPGRPSTAKSTWDPRLIYDIALGVDDTDTILDRHNLDIDTLERLFNNQMFRADVLKLRQELQEDGVTLKTKARIQSESYLVKLDQMVHDDDVPASTRLECIKYVGKLGDVEPEKKADGAGGDKFGIQIIIGGKDYGASV